MEQLLIIDSCTRPSPESRTACIAKTFIDEYLKQHKDTRTTYHTLRSLRLSPYYIEDIEQRNILLEKKEFEHPMFTLAQEFAQADKIIIAAPFWDCCFPAMLKTYFEHICVQDITFGYDQTGQIGLCKASDLAYITTSGGYYTAGPTADMEIASQLIKAMAKMYGIPHCHSLFTDGLDIIGNDVKGIMSDAQAKARSLARTF